jgi:hypothetical protein
MMVAAAFLSFHPTQTFGSLPCVADEAIFFLSSKLSIAQHSIIVTLRRQIESYKLLSFITAPPTHGGSSLILPLLGAFARYLQEFSPHPLIAIKICGKGW